MSLFTKRERSLIFSAIKKACFLKSMLLLKFLIRWCSNILNLFNISMMLNKFILQWFWVNVTTRAQLYLTQNKRWSKIYKIVLSLAYFHFKFVCINNASVTIYNGCFVFRLVNGCYVCCSLVEIIFLKLKQLFPSLTEQNKEKQKENFTKTCKTCNKWGVYQHLCVTL